jgi:hypothetical protein
VFGSKKTTQNQKLCSTNSEKIKFSLTLPKNFWGKWLTFSTSCFSLKYFLWFARNLSRLGISTKIRQCFGRRRSAKAKFARRFWRKKKFDLPRKPRFVLFFVIFAATTIGTTWAPCSECLWCRSKNFCSLRAIPESIFTSSNFLFFYWVF